MENQSTSDQKLPAQEWRRRLEQAGLGELAGALADGLKPLSPLAAQLLWFAQPGFALFGQADAVGALANALSGDDDPSPDHV